MQGRPENIDASTAPSTPSRLWKTPARPSNCLYEYLDNWDQTLAQQDVANALAQYGDQIEVVFCNNDAMALGALQSIEQAGRTVGNRTSTWWVLTLWQRPCRLSSTAA